MLPFPSFQVPPAVLLPRVWQYRLWSFQERDTKLERLLAKIQSIFQKEIIVFCELMYWRVIKNWPIFQKIKGFKN